MKRFPVRNAATGEATEVIGTVAAKVWKFPNKQLLVEPVGQLDSPAVLFMLEVVGQCLSTIADLYAREYMMRHQQAAAGEEEGKPEIALPGAGP